jgi:hypothetical protein
MPSSYLSPGEGVKQLDMRWRVRVLAS